MAKLLTSRAIQGAYYRAIESAGEGSWVPLLTNFFPSNQKKEDYPFLHDVPALAQWIGSRRMTDVQESNLAIKNLSYESGIRFENDDLELDKSGQVMLRVGELGDRVGQFPEKLVSELLVANGAAYDGVNFFGTHNVPKRPTITNALTEPAASGTTPTVSEMTSAILRAMATIKGAKDSEGEPTNSAARQFALLVPTDFYPTAVSAVGSAFIAGGVTNPLESVLNRGFGVQVFDNPRLATPYIYLFRTDARIRAGILQEQKRATSMLGPGSDFEVTNDAQYFGVTWKGGAALGRYELACRVEFT